ncbi:MAG TPA: hypothetical protein VFV67_33785 [Actinophytocola sp.]|uniref:hypothetical protein n=1 Tax=Actinophytocola sp. TaxID=1872138 RepID=UPI002DB8E2B9|nr:hypothetical protein [Actinophytocola sp.]HEU5475641.1 hypothetical protein [Actinophytocola sp.]
MRLSILDHGHRLRARLFLSATSRDAPDVPRMLLYRPDFVARPLLAITAPAMRGPSYWTAAEREYLAMTTAARHECPFCVTTHTELIRIAGHGEIDPDDPTSPRPELRAVRAFLDTLHTAPDTATPPADLPEEAVREALRVGLVWDIVNRLANAFGFTLRGDQLHSGTRALHRFGYRFPGFLLAGGDRTDHGDPIATLRHAVFTAPATTGPALRTAAGTGTELAEPWQTYTALVRETSHQITDADLDRLTAAGHTEDEIFEVTVAAAVGAALATYDTGDRLLARKS